ncbi:hypothetical protein EV2_032968 [Malus domestica]
MISSSLSFALLDSSSAIFMNLDCVLCTNKVETPYSFECNLFCGLLVAPGNITVLQPRLIPSKPVEENPNLPVHISTASAADGNGMTRSFILRTRSHRA